MQNETEAKKILGVIGGLGPMASAYFLHLVTEMTDAKTDQEHIEILLHSCPQIPDRTAYILDHTKESPLPLLTAVGKGLKRGGAEIIAMPCITAHYFQETLEKEIGIPIINAIEETASMLAEKGITSAGIMATNGTVQSGLFQRALEKRGISAVLPSEERQRDVMHIIYENVKAGVPIEAERVHALKEHFSSRGSEVILLGCTELSMIKRDLLMDEGFFDVMEALAQVAVKTCGRLKPAYASLLSL